MVVEWVRFTKSGKDWPQSRIQELEEVKVELFTTFGSLTNAESKLLLVGEDDAYNKLRELGEAVVQFRPSCYVDKTSLTESDIDEKKSHIKQL